jgi:GT2 family glycosyltransferase
MQRNAATIVLVPHNDLARAQTRLLRDIAPSLRHYPDWSFELLVIDNSEKRLDLLATAVADLPWPSRYIWHNGTNLFYGPALNIAAGLARLPVMLYLCANHGRMIDPGWLEDLVRPFWEDARVAMTGHLYPSGPPSALGFSNSLEPFHIQGGVLGLRTDAIRRHPYPDGQYAHWGSDVVQSFRLMAAGFSLCPVPSVISVWRSLAPAGRWKYIHDASEG